MKLELFDNIDELKPPDKTYRAIRHDVVRGKQSGNNDAVHHPNSKKKQIRYILESKSKLKILELFAGRGNLTDVYIKFGAVYSCDKKYLKTGDSFILFHSLISQKKKYDVIDIDAYGFPSRFLPDIYLLMDNGIIFMTMPKPNVNILNGITATHLISYYGSDNPSEREIINRIVLYGLCHWRKVELLDCLDLKSVWRFAFKVEKVKATEYTGVKNR